MGGNQGESHSPGQDGNGCLYDSLSYVGAGQCDGAELVDARTAPGSERAGRVYCRAAQCLAAGDAHCLCLITVLFNRTQPLIRYELSDSVCLATGPCPSGHPFALVDDIQGRVEDVLSFQSEAFGGVNVHPLVFSRIMDTLPVS